jgi:hypothetical protein
MKRREHEEPLGWDLQRILKKLDEVDFTDLDDREVHWTNRDGNVWCG